MKIVVRTVLLLFVAVSVAHLAFSERGAKPGPEDARSPAPTQPRSHQEIAATRGRVDEPDQRSVPEVAAYYFHGTSRCSTCLKMERYAKEAIEASFSDVRGGGRVHWQAVDYDEPANEHFVKKYDLVASSLVIVSDRASMPGGWRKLDRTWDLVGDETAFKEYVTDQVRSMLESNP